MNEPMTIEAAEAALDAAMAKSRELRQRSANGMLQLARGEIDAKAMDELTKELTKATREANKRLRELERMQREKPGTMPGT